jgi:hypothetical protein
VAELIGLAGEVPVVLAAALVHAELAVVRPFVRGNGLVARAAERALVAAAGLDPTGVAVPEAGVARGWWDGLPRGAHGIRLGDSAGRGPVVAPGRAGDDPSGGRGRAGRRRGSGRSADLSVRGAAWALCRGRHAKRVLRMGYRLPFGLGSRRIVMLPLGVEQVRTGPSPPVPARQTAPVVPPAGAVARPPSCSGQVCDALFLPSVG